MEISKQVFMNLIRKIYSEIASLDVIAHLPGTNELYFSNKYASNFRYLFTYASNVKRPVRFVVNNCYKDF